MSATESTYFGRRLDDAARAGWLYYIAGYKQDEIARSLGVSRQTAQRLVALAVREKLVTVRMEHPIMNCMSLAERLRARYALLKCEVVPEDPLRPDSGAGLGQAGAVAMEHALKASKPSIITIGTGRSLKASVEELSAMNCPRHTIVARLGHMSPEGLASKYNVVVRMADRVNAKYYPAVMPVYSKSREEREAIRKLDTVREIHKLTERADATFVGIGNIGPDAPMHIDGFLSQREVGALTSAGGVGEITGWIYDEDGNILRCAVNERVNSVPLRRASRRPIYGIAGGPSKIAAIRGALHGQLINCLITNEQTAELLL
ncbi:sugar-binding transcriptional regulator [Nitratireductor sp. ZSWI3]|uniref:sugar-binding transcriptional regulator n=1 Tax=Nitratireductor sp. ZSWI3 TaxID=2966359 RepID=UPI00214F92F3|nr:sugar-binding transcriptional regulator [Nitratireductor sp. ZSWI3]MCR4268308.1 sugar-binding transcriptional regulator [Nitratireductor sp. ZSWI3]